MSTQQTGGQIIPWPKRFNSFRETLSKMEKQFAMALPKHLKPERLIRIVLTEVTKNPKLLDCSEGSMIGAILQAAQLGLEPGGVLGQAYLVPFKNYKKGGALECQLITGYKGLIKLAYQSGEVGAIRARVVREKDAFRYHYGLEEQLVHEPWRGPEAGELVAVYAVAKIKGVDEAQFLVLERWEADLIRHKFSASADKGPWVDDFDEMAKKSALRRLCKLLPASTENQALARAVALDEHAEAGIPQEFDNVIDVSVAEPEAPDEMPTMPAGQPTKLDKLAADRKAGKKLTIEIPPSESNDPGDQLPPELGGDPPEPGSGG